MLAVDCVESNHHDTTKPISHKNLDASRTGCAYPHPDTRNNIKIDKSASNCYKNGGGGNVNEWRRWIEMENVNPKIKERAVSKKSVVKINKWIENFSTWVYWIRQENWRKFLKTDQNSRANRLRRFQWGIDMKRNIRSYWIMISLVV